MVFVNRNLQGVYNEVVGGGWVDGSKSYKSQKTKLENQKWESRVKIRTLKTEGMRHPKAKLGIKARPPARPYSPKTFLIIA